MPILPNMRLPFALPTWARGLLLVSVMLATTLAAEGCARAEDTQSSAGTNGCSGSEATVFVEYKIWAECLSLLVIGRSEEVHTAIIFVGGDVPADRQPPTPEMLHTFAERSGAISVSRDEHMPVIILGRPGLYGSTGNHQYRHRPMEYGLVARAIELLVQRFELVRVALVGHSGGSSAIMGALSLGAKEGDCVVVASGNYAIAYTTVRKYENAAKPVSGEQKQALQRHIFNHHTSLTGIIHSPRRIFLVGDITDQFAPFLQQVRYAESLETAGHPVRLIEARAPNGDGHTFINMSLEAAAHCLKGEDDARIVRVFEGVLRIP